MTKIAISDPATALQQTIIENVEYEQVPILQTVLELLNLQYEYHQVHGYYAKRCNELVAFDRVRKNDY